MRAAAWLLIVAACARGGADGGGADHLPISGVGPYRKITDFAFVTPLEEPFVVVLTGTDLSDPAPVERGDDVRVFYSRGDAIWRSDMAATFAALPSDPVQTLAASEAWEDGAVRAPAVVTDGADGERLVMFYQGRGAGIGRAESTDGGDTWSKRGRVLEDGASPAALRVRDRWFLYFTRPGQLGIFAATSDDDGESWAEIAGAVLPAGGSPDAAGGETAAGEVKIDLFFEDVGASGIAAIGIAGSTDGLVFSRKPGAVLPAAAPGERTPGVLFGTTRALLFFAEERAGRLAIAVATAP
jgi:hypothetical protein